MKWTAPSYPWPTVCVDFDGVLAEYRGDFKSGAMGTPLPGALAFTRRLEAEGFYIVVLTARRDLNRVGTWLAINGFPPYPVTNTKPPAVAYLDDRAVRFRGNWDDALRGIREKAHWERPDE